MARRPRPRTLYCTDSSSERRALVAVAHAAVTVQPPSRLHICSGGGVQQRSGGVQQHRGGVQQCSGRVQQLEGLAHCNTARAIGDLYVTDCLKTASCTGVCWHTTTSHTRPARAHPTPVHMSTTSNVCTHLCKNGGPCLFTCLCQSAVSAVVRAPRCGAAAANGGLSAC